MENPPKNSHKNLKNERKKSDSKEKNASEDKKPLEPAKNELKVQKNLENSDKESQNSKKSQTNNQIKSMINAQHDEEISKMESRAKTYKRERYVKNQYKNRTSLLDDCSEDSYLNNSAFLGIVNLGKLVAIFFIITTPIVNKEIKFIQ